MLCGLLGLGLNLAFGSVTSESESVLHSMSLSVTDNLFFLLYDHKVKAFLDWIKIRLKIIPNLLRYCLTACGVTVLRKINSPTLHRLSGVMVLSKINSTA